MSGKAGIPEKKGGPRVKGPVIVAAVIAGCVAVLLLRPGEGPPSPAVAAATPAVASAPTSPPPEVKLPDLSPAEQRDTIALVRNTWRSETGEKIDAILDNAAKVAHFYRRGPWEAYRDFDGQPMAGIAFVRSKAAKDDEAFTVYWRIEKDGSISAGPPGFKAVEVGSKAFAQMLIQDEITNEVKAPNTRYLFDPKNLDWLQTKAGPLSGLLIRSQCRSGDALFPAYFRSEAEHRNRPDLSEWSFSTTVYCKKGPVYCADGGPLMFDRNGRGTWAAASTCAKLLVGEAPPEFFEPILRERKR